MSSAAPIEVQFAAEDENSLGAILRARWEALKGGDVGSLPVIIGIIGIGLYFTFQTEYWLRARMSSGVPARTTHVEEREHSIV